MTNFINPEAFAEHIKMIIDSDRSMHDYLYNLAAKTKKKGKGMSQLRDALEQEFDDMVEQVDSHYLSTVLSKVFSNSDFYYQLCLMIWEDERVNELMLD